MKYKVETIRKLNNAIIRSVMETFQDVCEFLENISSDNESVDNNTSILAHDEMVITYGDLTDDICEFFQDNPQGLIVHNGDRYDECTPENGGTIYLADYTVIVTAYPEGDLCSYCGQLSTECLC